MEDRLFLSHISAINACNAPRMARSRSTPALEPRARPGVVTHITHTRIIRSGSLEPPKSIYSVFSSLEGKKRASSTPRSVESWSRGSSMSRGSSTESLMTLAEARKKREGSQESITSTRSLKVISGRSITSGVTRRGAKLNKDIQAPWVGNQKAARVASAPSLTATGGGGSSSTTTTKRSSSAHGGSPPGNNDRRTSLEIPKHLEQIEKQLGIKPRFKSAPDVRVDYGSGGPPPPDDDEDLGFDEDDVTQTGSNMCGELPLDVGIEHVTAGRSSEVYARGRGVRRRHTDLPERVARSRAKAQEEEARKEKEKEVIEKEEPGPPPAPVLEKVNKTNGVFTEAESNTKELTSQPEEEEGESNLEQGTQTEFPFPSESDIITEETQLDIDNPTPSKKRKVDRTSVEEELELEQENQNRDESIEVPVSFNMAGNPGPMPTTVVEGAEVVGTGAGAAGAAGGIGGSVSSDLLEAKLNYPSSEPHSIYPGGQAYEDEEEEEEFEIEVEVVPESYMETPAYEEEEPEFDNTQDWDPETPSFDDSDYYSYISESFERRDRIIRAMREQEMEQAAQEGEPFSLQSSLDETEYSAYDDYVIPYISKNEPHFRHSWDLSDFSDEFNQVPPYLKPDTEPPTGRALSDSTRQPPAGQSGLEEPINEATGGSLEDTTASLRKPLGKPQIPKGEVEGDILGSSPHFTAPDSENKVVTDSDRYEQKIPAGEDQRVPDSKRLVENQGDTSGLHSGALGDKNAQEPGALSERTITSTEIPKVESVPADKPKRTLKSILKRSPSTDSQKSREGDRSKEPEPQVKRYSYTEDSEVLPGASKGVEKSPVPVEKAAESSLSQHEKDIQKKPYYETEIDLPPEKEIKAPEIPSPKEEAMKKKNEKMSEIKSDAPGKRREKAIFPTFSEFLAIDLRDSSTLDYRMRLTILDIIMNFLLITPLVVLHYHALSNLLELLFLQYFPRIGTLLLFSVGVAIEFCCIFFQKSIISSVPRPSPYPEAENIHFILASKAFNFVLAFGNICHMLAATEFIDLYIGEPFGASFKTAVTSIIILWALRCGRNLIGPPLYLSIDHDDVGVFSTSTLFKTEHDGSAESAVDTLGTTAVVFTCVHLHWAGVWNCLDAVFFPGTFWLSMITSVSVGYGLCLAFLFLQEPAHKISRNLQRDDKEPLRIAFENAFNTAANIGVVLLWKGLWMVYDVMADYFPIYCRSWDITSLASTVLSFVLLSLAHCSSSLLFQNCEIDGEIRDGEGVLFTTGYLSEILDDFKETTTDESSKDRSDNEQANMTPTTAASPTPMTTPTVAKEAPSASVSIPKQPMKTKSGDVRTGPISATQSEQKIA